MAATKRLLQYCPERNGFALGRTGSSCNLLEETKKLGSSFEALEADIYDLLDQKEQAAILMN